MIKAHASDHLWLPKLYQLEATITHVLANKNSVLDYRGEFRYF